MYQWFNYECTFEPRRIDLELFVVGGKLVVGGLKAATLSTISCYLRKCNSRGDTTLVALGGIKKGALLWETTPKFVNAGGFPTLREEWSASSYSKGGRSVRLGGLDVLVDPDNAVVDPLLSLIIIPAPTAVRSDRSVRVLIGSILPTL